MLRNNKGISLYEILAALAISSILIITIMYFTQYSHNSVNQLASREQILSESRTIMNHIVEEVKQGRVRAVSNPGHVLILNGYEYYIDGDGSRKDRGTYNVYYTLDRINQKFNFLKEKADTRGIIQQHTFSNHVKDMSITIDGSKLSIRLTMQLPKGQTYESSTVVYIPQLD